ncbi:MAG TPA: hypothetical protein VG125_19755 [Pirellulales bacterium]|jgi:hypothetical protein|nr:hypothetical protein [Pirellulales bacterium]
MWFLLRLTVFSAVALVPTALWAQLPPGYWSYYDSGNKHHHRTQNKYELQRQQASGGAAHEPWVRPGPPGDPMDYQGRGMTGRGLSAYQSNGYTGPNQNLYYGYWDGGFTPGLYGFSMYSHFDRPGFTYWQY